MRRYESGAGCGTRERGEVLELTPATTSGGPPGKACLGNTGPAGPAAVNAISGAMPRGAHLERWIASRMMRPGPVRVVRPVTPGPPWRNPGHALLGAPPLALGKEKERKTGEPPRPSKATGANPACLSRCLTCEQNRVRRSILSAVVPAQAGTHNPSPIESARRMGPRLRGDDTERRQARHVE